MNRASSTEASREADSLEFSEAIDDLREGVRRIEQTLRKSPPQKHVGQLLTVREVSEQLAVSVRTVETLIESGELLPIWIRGTRRFDPRTVDAFVRSCSVGPRRRRSSG